MTRGEFPGVTLRAARVNAGLTQNEVAGKLKKTKQTIVNWESGRTAIKWRDLQTLSSLYEIPVEYLIISDSHTGHLSHSEKTENKRYD